MEEPTKERPEIKAQLVRNGDWPAMERFDRDFWREAGPSARLNAASEMFDEYYWYKGLDARAAVFQRNIGSLQRKAG
jgi:hypothetical protein